jgi:hypothetical protein
MRSILGIAMLLTACKNDYDIHREVVTDAFTQPIREDGVDILWVIDNSASMYEERLQLTEHADSFISYLSAVPVNFQLGVVSTDMSTDAPGALVGNMLSPDTADLVARFKDQIDTIQEGSRNEHGFEAARLGSDPDGINADFNRSISDLEVVFFTDEDDQSTLTALELLEALEFQRDGRVVANAIVGDPPVGCASLEAAADAGGKYIAAQELSEGLRESICALDYPAMLERIALRVLGLESTFLLRAVPDPSQMTVNVDGAIIQQRERHGWRYDPGLNAVIFDGYAIPQPGAEIFIRYYEWLGPALEDEQTDAGE